MLAEHLHLIVLYFRLAEGHKDFEDSSRDQTHGYKYFHTLSSSAVLKE